MSTVFSRAELNLAVVMKAQLGIECTYYQAYGEEDEGFTVTMWRGGKTRTENTDYGVEEWEDHSFFCLAAELTADRGVTKVTPERGHVITFEDDEGETQTFTVGYPGEGDPYAYSDKAKQILRVHCREGLPSGVE